MPYVKLVCMYPTSWKSVQRGWCGPQFESRQLPFHLAIQCRWRFTIVMERVVPDIWPNGYPGSIRISGKFTIRCNSNQKPTCDKKLSCTSNKANYSGIPSIEIYSRLVFTTYVGDSRIHAYQRHRAGSRDPQRPPLDRERPPASGGQSSSSSSSCPEHQ